MIVNFIYLFSPSLANYPSILANVTGKSQFAMSIAFSHFMDSCAKILTKIIKPRRPQVRIKDLIFLMLSMKLQWRGSKL